MINFFDCRAFHLADVPRLRGRLHFDSLGSFVCEIVNPCARSNVLRHPFLIAQSMIIRPPLPVWQRNQAITMNAYFILQISFHVLTEPIILWMEFILPSRTSCLHSIVHAHERLQCCHTLSINISWFRIPSLITHHAQHMISLNCISQHGNSQAVVC